MPKPHKPWYDEMPDRDPAKTAARRARRVREIGPDAVCLFCSYAPGVQPVSRRWMEEHHVAAYMNDEDLVAVLCRRCHDEVSEGYRAAGVPTRPPRSARERVRGALRGIGAFLPALGAACFRYADLLEDDEDSPS